MDLRRSRRKQRHEEHETNGTEEESKDTLVLSAGRAEWEAELTSSDRISKSERKEKEAMQKDEASVGASGLAMASVSGGVDPADWYIYDFSFQFYFAEAMSPCIIGIQDIHDLSVDEMERSRETRIRQN